MVKMKSCEKCFLYQLYLVRGWDGCDTSRGTVDSCGEFHCACYDPIEEVEDGKDD